MKKAILCLTLILSTFSHALPKDSNSSVKMMAKAVRISEPIIIDGKLDEASWKNSFKLSDLTQRDPIEGIQPTEKTEVMIAYDDNALYIGARMYDSRPDSIIARLGRRDVGISADQFFFFVDPYRDKRTGYYFGINAGGTMYDGVLYNDDWNDNSWDGVWEAKTSIDNQGWTAEIRIPFSQLRFHESPRCIWGINVQRVIERKNENDYLVYTPKNGSGFVSRFIELEGPENIHASGRVEILPYIVGKAEYLQHDAEDPFHKGSNYTPGIGADIKVGFGSNFTLNATINPDFGQVEVDPAVVNLSDVESFFNEKRPFFIEGLSIFNFGQGGARNYWSFNFSTPDMFYSRRIGRTPQGSLPDNYDYSDVPQGTHILGAAKLTGKTGNGWNVGLISALTRREYADIQYQGEKSTLEVEPTTYYGVYRAQKDFNDGAQGLGFMSTYTKRFFKEANLENQLNSNSAEFGIDGWTFLDESKTWVFTGWTAATRVAGTKSRMIDLQENSMHYLQRPDAKYLGVDSNATSMTGYAGRFYLNKQKGNFFVNTAFGFIDPKFDVNDAGFMWRGDMINMHAGAGYNWPDPGKVFRRAELGAALFRSYNFDKDIIWEGIFHFGYLQLLNYYEMNWNLAYNPETINNRKTRGGPLMLNPEGWQADLSVYSDGRKDWVFSAGYDHYLTREGSKSFTYSVGAEWRPSSNVSVSFSPSYSTDLTIAQWVTSTEDATAKQTYGSRYIFARLDQKTVSANIRLNWIFSPALSLQLFIQPLISAGSYTKFKEVARPRSFDYNIYGESNNSTIKRDGDQFVVDPDGNGPAPSFSFDDPDFNFKSLRGNAVLRWEYHPGSVLYFVWTQSRSESEVNGEFNFSRSLDRLVNTRADNIFMIKFTYWLSML